MNTELFDFIKKSPTPFHAVRTASEMLESAGYSRLSEAEEWALEPGRGYYVTRNGSSVIAFRAPKNLDAGFMISAAHCDSPCFKLRENTEVAGKSFTQLSAEVYGGMIYSTWLDRPLGVAGRVLVKSGEGIESRLVDFKEPVCLIPNVAIHMNRSVNKDTNYNPAVDLQPLYSLAREEKTFRSRVALLAGVSEEELLGFDLYLYNPQEPTEWSDFISAPRLDDLQCAYASLRAFLDSETGASVPVCAIFDNEEVGSRTKQGAASTFLKSVLCRVSGALGLDFDTSVARSLMLSCDNAHSVHPNHPEYADKNHAPVIGGGIVIKFNAAQSYASDGVSAALFKLICAEAGAKYQYYVNRPDIPGGGTLGNISNAQVSLDTVDIGLPQLAMHSSYETAGREDTAELIKALRVFFGKGLVADGLGGYKFR